jgi:hypothetical protein
MRRRVQLQTVLLLFIIALSSSTIFSVSARNYLQKTTSSIELSVNQTGVILLDPFGQQTKVNVTIHYTYGKLARPTGFPLPNRKQATPINISIDQQPSWCLVSLDIGSCEALISTFLLKKNQTFTFSAHLTIQCINQTARALQDGIIRLNVTAAANGNILTSSLFYDLRVSPTRFLLSQAIVNGSPLITMVYGEEKNTTLTVKNLGNTKTSYRIKPTTPSDVLNISFDKQPYAEDFVLDINEEKQILINLQSRTNEKQNQLQTLRFSITSEATDDSSDQGTPLNVALQVNLNAPTKKSGEFSFEHVDLIVIIAALLVVLPLIVVFILFLRKKKKRDE